MVPCIIDVQYLKMVGHGDAWKIEKKRGQIRGQISHGSR
jgi:hypothetical protein